MGEGERRSLAGGSLFELAAVGYPHAISGRRVDAR